MVRALCALLSRPDALVTSVWHVEADVLLDLVVDGEGRVTSARPSAAEGLGLADAAVRAYRFSPARRAGHPVRVRMRWTVAFCLQ